MAAGLTQPWKESDFLEGVWIPAPSGRFAVGCVDLMHRLDGDEEGGLLVRLFYPTASPRDEAETREMQSRYPYAKWLPNPRYINGYAAFYASLIAAVKPNTADKRGTPTVGGRAAIVAVVAEFITGLVRRLINARVPAHEGAPVLPAESSQGATPSPSFPAIVFSHGLGAMRTVCSSICGDLASHGYVVAAVEHRVPAEGTVGRQRYRDEWLPYYYRPDSEEEIPLRNRQVRQRANDVKRSLDLLGLLNEGARIENMMDGDFDFSQFKGRIDVGTAAVMGHSFGGATTVQTLSEDPRFSCGIALDTWMVPIHQEVYEAGLQRPLLFINSSDFQWVENVQQMMRLSRAPDENGMSTCRVVTLRGSNHASQSDLVLVVPNFTLKGQIKPTRDQTEVFALNMAVCHSFLRRHLLRDPDYLKPVPNLDGLDGHSEYLIFGSNLDLGKATRGAAGAQDSKDGRHKILSRL